ncbi:MAG: ribose-5-phosphate isomerase [Anaerolineae bacterium]|nr:ribose-5-phosphate isomerase [Anaerolineae bacterium]
MPNTSRKVALGSDHAGFRYKEAVKAHLIAKGIEVVDFGADSPESTDYPLFIRPAAEAVADGKCTHGIVFGGSGNGEAIMANKVDGIRCAVCWSVETAQLATAHNNANMISIGERVVALETTLALVDAWLETEFEGGRHARRIGQIRQYELERP